MKIVKIERKKLVDFSMNDKFSMKFLGKMLLKIILNVTKKLNFTFPLGNSFL